MTTNNKKYVTKTKCLEFIERVEKKATSSVTTDYNTKLTTKLYEILKEAGQLDKILLMEEKLKEVIRINKEVNLHEDDNFKIRDRSRRYYRSDIVNNEIHESSFKTEPDKEYTPFVRDYIFYYTDRHIDIKNKEYLAIKAECKEKINAVRCEYQKVYCHAKTLRDGKTVVKYLDSLGFDTSSLYVEVDTSGEIDTNKLFVCGQNK